MLDAAMEMVGFFTAQAVEVLAAGEPLGRWLCQVDTVGSRSSTPLTEDGQPVPLLVGRRLIARVPTGAGAAALLYHGDVRRERQVCDALLIEGRCYAEPAQSFEVVLRFRHAAAPGGLAIWRPRFTMPHLDPDRFDQAADAFVAGVLQHPAGAALWARYAQDERS